MDRDREKHGIVTIGMIFAISMLAIKHWFGGWVRNEALKYLAQQLVGPVWGRRPVA
jgi:hypothetical protein